MLNTLKEKFASFYQSKLELVTDLFGEHTLPDFFSGVFIGLIMYAANIFVAAFFTSPIFGVIAIVSWVAKEPELFENSQPFLVYLVCVFTASATLASYKGQDDYGVKESYSSKFGVSFGVVGSAILIYICQDFIVWALTHSSSQN